MASTPGRTSSGRHALRVESGKLLLPDDIAGRISNMERTPEGTLRSVRGPLPYVPDYGAGYPAYLTMQGVHHGTLNSGQREILLINSGPAVWEFQGWNTPTVAVGSSGIWRYLASDGGFINLFLTGDGKGRMPMMAETLPNGIAFIPSGSTRVFFYDGDVCAPLGYDHAPGAPWGHGPQSSYHNTANDIGYKHDGLHMHPDFRMCRVGTVSNIGGLTAAGKNGQLDDAQYYGAVQWLDLWGNVSPISEKSNDVIIARDDSNTYRGELLLYQVAWSGISKGPDRTVGRILLRTKNTLHSGSSKFFEVPPNALGGSPAESTIPDNVTEIYPDNAPDSWLIREPLDPVPFPPTHVIRQAFGRLFVADGGKLYWSEPGFWGTILKHSFVYPDPSGQDITGLWRIPEGLLVCTLNSTFILTPSDDGRGFRSYPIDVRRGCIAPASFGTLPNGDVVWLGQDGFYVMRGTNIVRAEDIDSLFRRANRARLVQSCAGVTGDGEYRCWIPVDASRENNLTICYDGMGWRELSGVVNAAGVCTTDDHRRYMIAVGTATDSGATERDGVWLLDHEVYSYVPATRQSVIETGWMGVEGSDTRKTRYRVFLWLRETSTDTLTVNVYQNWRKHVQVMQTTTPVMRPLDDKLTIPIWGTAYFDGTDDQEHAQAWTWVKRRPFWQRVEIYIPSCEVFKLEIIGTSNWEFIGLSVEEDARGSGMARTPGE